MLVQDWPQLVRQQLGVVQELARLVEAALQFGMNIRQVDKKQNKTKKKTKTKNKKAKQKNKTTTNNKQQTKHKTKNLRRFLATLRSRH